MTNEASRYLPTRTVIEDDGWHADTESSAPSTQFLAERTRTLITRNQSPDISFSQSINPYKGCEHGCVYCFARPTHAYLDLSPGLDFETRIFYKTDVKQHLLAELGRAGYACSVIAMGTNTDPYQPGEKRLRITRTILQTLLDCRHPVSLVTKSALIQRDIDLLAEMAALGLVTVHVSVTTLSNDLKTRLEPRTAGPSARLRTISALREAGVPVGAMVAPLIPFINDHEIEDIVGACAGAGAQDMNYILIRLPREVAPLFEAWLQAHYPMKAARVMSAIRDTRGGRRYRSNWHQRMVGQGEIAKLIKVRFAAALKSAGLIDAEMPRVRTDLFMPPVSSEPQQTQLF